MANENTYFYNNLKHRFGDETAKLFKLYSTNNKKLSNYTSHKKFLIKCRQDGIIPNHINFSFNGVYHFFKPNSRRVKRLDKLTQNWKKDLLNLEISEIFSILNDLRNSNKLLAITIKHRTPSDVHNNFFTLQRNYLRDNSERLQKSKNGKFNKLKNRLIHDSIPNTIAKDKWILNYTDIDLPPETKLTLGLGEKFAINEGIDEIPFLRLISDVEYALTSIESSEERSSLRNSLANNILNFTTKNRHLDFRDKFFINNFRTTSKFIREYNDNINQNDSNGKFVIAKTDKSKQTVVLYENEYNAGILKLLNDDKNYKITKKDPTKRIIDKNKRYVKKLFDSEHINGSIKFKLTPKNVNAPKIYGLVKSHKTGVGRGNIVLRPVVAYLGSPLYELSKFLGTAITAATNCDLILKNSYQFCSLIKNHRIPTGYKLVSFDIVSLFTCLPQDFLLDCIKQKWDDINKHTQLSQEEFLEGVDLCLSNSYLQFQGNYYLQVNGTPMGAPISSSIAVLGVIIVFQKIRTLLPFEIPFIYDYVDDSITAVPEDSLQLTLDIFNSINPQIQFTYEVEVNGKIPYLDTLIIRNSDGSISTDFYQKPLSSNRILNYYSAHSMSLKRNTALGLIKRVFTFSSIKTSAEKCNLINKILLDNNYPKRFINSLLNKYGTNQYAISSQTSSNLSIEPNVRNIPHSSIVHVKGLTSDLIHKIKAKNGGKNIAVTMHNTVRKIFTRVKDPIPFERKSHLIYKIKCLNCPSSYIGMTSRQTIQDRTKQHKNDQTKAIRTRQTTTALTEHVIDNDHTFNFDLKNVDILGMNTNYNKLKTLEMLHIFTNQNCCNKRSDVDNTIVQYQTLMNFLKSKDLI